MFQGWVNGVAVNWPYPEADAAWLPYLASKKSLNFTVAKDARLCTLLADSRVSEKVPLVISLV